MQYLRNCWYMADWSDSLAKGQIAAITLLEEPIALYRKSDGAAAALEDRCAHRLAPLSIGRIEGDDLRCMYHGLKFAPDGQCNEIPGQAHISSKVCVRSYPVVEKHGAVWIWMGRPDSPDASLIPDIVGPDDPDWAVQTSTLDFDANAALIADNLLDLSHAAWVHGASFGGGNKESIDIQKSSEPATEVEQLERGLRLRRWHAGRPSNPYMDTGPTDDLVINEFLAPGVFILRVRCYKPGVQQRRPNEEIPDEEPLLMRSTSQMITPTTEGKAKFFFTFGPWAKAASYARVMFDIGERAFKEDRFFIEAQQAMMRRSPERKPINLSMDAPLVRYQGILKGLLEQDRVAQQA
ncbi:MAG: aromatic ring-hydroxylating dioxygenase subunit alpha [Hyphomonadaceae bacterium]|nr:aromatic ring-hydroxylating dioxygenase subunit alpha [Hyphomonadaceae bacterium]